MNRSRMLLPIVAALIAVLGLTAIVLIANRHQSVERNSDAQAPVVQNAPPADSPAPGDETVTEESKPAEEQPQTDKNEARTSEGLREQPQRRAPDARTDSAQRDPGMASAFMLMGITRIDVDGISPDQAKKILEVLTPLRSKPRLTEQESQQAGQRLREIFTSEQLEAMFRPRREAQSERRPDQDSSRERPARERPQVAPTEGQRPAGPRASGESTPGTRPERPSQPRTETRRDPDLMRDFNPFYAQAPAGGEWGEARVKRMDEFFESLKKRAAQK